MVNYDLINHPAVRSRRMLDEDFSRRLTRMIDTPEIEQEMIAIIRAASDTPAEHDWLAKYANKTAKVSSVTLASRQQTHRAETPLQRRTRCK